MRRRQALLTLLAVAVATLGGIVVTAALIGMLMFVSVTQQIFISRSRIWETALLLLASGMLFLPGMFMDRVTQSTLDRPAADIVAIAEAAPEDAFMRVEVSGIDLSGEEYTRVVRLPLGEPGDGAERLSNAGLQVAPLAGDMQVINVRFRSQAERLGLSIGQSVERVLVPNPDRPAPEWMFVPALALIALVAGLQWRRRKWDQPGQARTRPA